MNNTPSVPLGSAFANGELVFQHLGNLWTHIFQSSGSVHALMAGSGLLQAQTYLNFLEALNLADRKNVPVFHRERWRLIVLRLSQRTTGAAAALSLDMNPPPVIGPQVAAPYPVGAVFTIGGYVSEVGVTTYPTGSDGLVDVVTAISDSIAAPKHALVKNVDFVIRDETIMFLNGNDPFTLGFPSRTVDNGDGTTDTEVGIWATDALLDRDSTWNYAGYALNIRDVSSEFYARYLGALWDMYNGGGTLALFQAGLAALLDEPCSVAASETVQQMLTTPRKQIVTDQNVYTLSDSGTFNPAIKVGSTLVAGTILTDSVRVYDNLQPTSDEALAQLQLDTAALFLPAGFFRARLSYGIGLSWQLVPITYHGANANGDPRLRFTVYGDPTDIAAFWEEFEATCERQSINPRSCFPGVIRANVLPVEGAVWGQLSAVEYFISNLLRANLLIVAVDVNKLTAHGRSKLGLLALMKKVLPARCCLFVVERQTLTPDTYDLGTAPTDTATPAVAVAVSDSAGLGYKKTHMTYGDGRPSVYLIPACPGVVQ